MNQPIIKKVCVYAASSTKVNPVFFDAARRLGKILAQHNIISIYGGGSVGLMGNLAEAVLENNGKIIGIIPEFMMEFEWGNRQVTELIVVQNMTERKKRLIDDVDAVIAMPDGTGTLEELAEVISMKKLGMFLKPIIILNINGFYDLLITFLEKMISENFMHACYRNAWSVIKQPEEVIDAIYKSAEWNMDMGRYSAI